MLFHVLSNEVCFDVVIRKGERREGGKKEKENGGGEGKGRRKERGKVRREKEAYQ